MPLPPLVQQSVAPRGDLCEMLRHHLVNRGLASMQDYRQRAEAN
ncbi:MAG: hypothetical protein BWZ02_00846 [Lentisphaerae bacterium ADurb.BinA184]|nr:MAG: hypothetical protein BWZ02_00846 [Lentisphaerae bacterium ADurb.BinA184]